MATTKKAPAAPPAKSNPDAFEIDAATEETPSQSLARLVTSSMVSAVTVKAYAGAGDGLEVRDLVTAMKGAGDEAVAGDLGRVERMLANQLLTLDVMFHNLAQRANRQEQFRGIETLMRLALKAQSQARATAETLGVLKNPMPTFVRQTNIAHGNQQVNNGRQPTGAGNFQSEPNKLLEADHGQRLDIGAQAATGQVNQAVEAVGAGDRPKNARRQGAGQS